MLGAEREPTRPVDGLQEDERLVLADLDVERHVRVVEVDFGLELVGDGVPDRLPARLAEVLAREREVRPGPAGVHREGAPVVAGAGGRGERVDDGVALGRHRQRGAGRDDAEGVRGRARRVANRGLAGSDAWPSGVALHVAVDPPGVEEGGDVVEQP